MKKSKPSKNIYKDTLQLANSQGIGMNWYKFIIYIQLFLGAIFNVLTSISYTTGGQYYGNAEQVYMNYAGLKMIDIAYGIIGIILSVCAFVIRGKMKLFMKDSPKYLNYYLTAQAIINCLYVILFVLITNVTDSIGNTTITVAVMIGLIIYNRKYFKDRELLFVN